MFKKLLNKWREYRRVPQVGDIWIFNAYNPFSKTVRIIITQIKGDWVEYRYLNYDGDLHLLDFKEISTLKYLYTREQA